MALILPCHGIVPQIGEDCFLAENATIVGDVVLGDQCSVWFQAVLRGDVNFIRIGNKVNIQDGAILHCTYQKCGTTIGNNVSIGHRALVHGCTLHDNVLIGMVKRPSSSSLFSISAMSGVTPRIETDGISTPFISRSALSPACAPT